MHRVVGTLLVGLAIAAAVTVGSRLLGQDGPMWAYALIGAGLALALWLMMFAGSYAGAADDRGRVPVAAFAVAGAVGVLLGALIAGFGGRPTWWAPGFILAGVMVQPAWTGRLGSGSGRGR